MGLLERFAISWRNIFRASSACSAHLPPSCNLCHRDAKPSFPIITKSLPLTAHNYADFYILFVLFGCRLTLYGSSLNKLFIPHFGVFSQRERNTTDETSGERKKDPMRSTINTMEWATRPNINSHEICIFGNTENVHNITFGAYSPTEKLTLLRRIQRIWVSIIFARSSESQIIRRRCSALPFAGHQTVRFIPNSGLHFCFLPCNPTARIYRMASGGSK